MPAAVKGSEQSNNTYFPSWMHIPIILPEELGAGYCGRIRVANGVRSNKELYQGIIDANPSLGSAPKARILAAIGGMSQKEFVCEHTLTPFSRAFVHGNHRHYPHGEDNDNHLRYSTMAPLRKFASFCTDCAEEDKNFWGFPYWRRIHQAPGVDWCPKHGTPLVHCNLQSLDALPTDSCEIVQAPASIALKDAPPVVARYIDISYALLEHSEPIHMRALQALLRGQAKLLGLRTSDRGQRDLLSDFAMQHCPQGWLIRILPGFSTKKHREVLLALDSTCRHGVGGSQMACVLALALLFPSADEAVRKIRLLKNTETQKSHQEPRLPKGFWDSEKLTALYIEHLGNQRKIAAALEISASHVAQCLRKAGLPSFKIANLPIVFAALKEFFRGEPLSTVCAKHSVAQSDLEYLLRHDLYRIREIFDRL